MRQAGKQTGFSLVEIAIVLILIGLLFGGVLKGQELINNTKVKTLIADLTRMPALVHVYQDKYRRLPGDDPDAHQHVGAAAGSNGNGNGQIDGNWNDAPAGGACASEACNVWLHVRLANLVVGMSRFDANYQPMNSEGGIIGIASTPPAAGWSGSFFVCSSGIQGRHAREIDARIDDGATDTGAIRVIGGSPVALQKLTSADDTTRYTVCAAF